MARTKKILATRVTRKVRRSFISKACQMLDALDSCILVKEVSGNPSWFYVAADRDLCAGYSRTSTVSALLIHVAAFKGC